MKKMLFLFALALSVTGCGTIINGAHQDELRIITRPAGVIATVGTQSCVTPCTLHDVWRKSEVVIFTEGSESITYELNRSTNVGSNIFGNLVTWFVFGWAFDSKVGGKYRIENINFTLHKKPGEPEDPNDWPLEKCNDTRCRAMIDDLI